MADRSRWMYLGNRTSVDCVDGLQSFLTVAHTDMSNGHKSSVCVHALIVRKKDNTQICR
jgi:hypothetical protein